MKIYSLSFFIALFTPVAALAEESSAPIEEVLTTGVRQKLDQAGRLMDVIQKTEIVDEIMIENKNALSLTDAINNEPGVNVSNECSMCGVKRVMLNGMKGEHTTILVDGLPTHTLISGFYAVDAISTSGVDRIEVARGAGASLIAPEAIGGTINIITKQATENGMSMNLAKGSHDFTALKLSGTAISSDAKTGLTLVGQYDKQDQEDHDDNLISEAPFQENSSLTALLSHDFDERNNLQLRLSKVSSEVFGGPVIGKITDSIGQTLAGYDGEDSDQLFVDNDVRQQYIGKPWEMTEWIKTDREESYVKWLREINEKLAGEFAVSYASHLQDSFYEGIDYVADDSMLYLRAKFDLALSDNHFLVFGVDRRTEEMRSESDALSGAVDYVSDSFDYSTTGIFIQDVWTPIEKLELALALRLDQIKADFIDEKKPGEEIDESVFAPRLDMRYFHSDVLTSRLSFGRGYRAPLSFFETDHGILDTELGYQIDVDALEESNSINYALSYDNERLSATFSLAHSEVENLANLTENEEGVPVLSQLDEKASVSIIDFVAGYQFTEQLLFEFSAENFSYDDEFRSSYAIAPVEQRVGFDLKWQGEKFSAFWSTTWFGSRDLTDYGYEGFDRLNQDGSPDLSSQKKTKADAFSSSNIRLKYMLSSSMNIYCGASNIFGYTQVEEEGSPLFYDADGGLDVAYIYGPLHGREFYAGFEVKL